MPLAAEEVDSLTFLQYLRNLAGVITSLSPENDSTVAPTFAISSSTIAVVSSTSDGIRASPRSSCWANSVSERYPSFPASEDIEMGALWARSNRCSVTIWISRTISSSFSTFTISPLTSRCTCVMAPGLGSSTLRFISLHVCFCSSRVMTLLTPA